ncbi:MAG TPA: hypothetical protein VIJ87_09920, partial [Pyrinomonadaceae bacterium]
MNEPSLSFVFSLDCCPALRKMLMGALLKFYREGRRSVPLRGSAWLGHKQIGTAQYKKKATRYR